MDLFSEQRDANRRRVTPLAVRMRPRSLDDFVGQESFIGEGKLLRRLLDADRLTSALFYGPPGTGKTSLAAVIAATTKAHYDEVNAASVGSREVREILSASRERLETSGQRTILFVDELHRFNRAQQDILLNDVEDGLVVLIGATTENPFFAINTPLLSRSQIFQFEPLRDQDVAEIVHRALLDSDKGLGRYKVNLAPDARDHLVRMADGDARRALTALELAVLSQVDRVQGAGGTMTVDLDTAVASIQRKAIPYDARGDGHYDSVSAMIKSIRGSDPDAAVYWLARMLEGGEDPRFIARRVVIAAAEDVGNADPMGLVVAQAAADATHLVGLPECRLPLAQAVTHLACAPKSNAAAKAIWSACEDVRGGRTQPVPRHLRSQPVGDGRDGYVNPHESTLGVVAQEYLGVDKEYYTPTNHGAEVVLAERLAQVRRILHDETCHVGRHHRRA